MPLQETNETVNIVVTVTLLNKNVSQTILIFFHFFHFFLFCGNSAIFKPCIRA